MRIGIVVVMSRVIEPSDPEIHVAHVCIVEPGKQLALQLIKDYSVKIKAEGELLSPFVTLPPPRSRTAVGVPVF